MVWTFRYVLKHQPSCTLVRAQVPPPPPSPPPPSPPPPSPPPPPPLETHGPPREGGKCEAPPAVKTHEPVEGTAREAMLVDAGASAAGASAAGASAAGASAASGRAPLPPLDAKRAKQREATSRLVPAARTPQGLSGDTRWSSGPPTSLLPRQAMATAEPAAAESAMAEPAARAPAAAAPSSAAAAAPTAAEPAAVPSQVEEEEEEAKTEHSLSDVEEVETEYDPSWHSPTEMPTDVPSPPPEEQEQTIDTRHPN